jgi:hypothetical protein
MLVSEYRAHTSKTSHNDTVYIEICDYQLRVNRERTTNCVYYARKVGYSCTVAALYKLVPLEGFLGIITFKHIPCYNLNMSIFSLCIFSLLSLILKK